MTGQTLAKLEQAGQHRDAATETVYTLELALPVMTGLIPVGLIMRLVHA